MAVDDEVDIIFTAKKELEQGGISLDVFNDPISALSNFKAHYYDLILLDATDERLGIISGDKQKGQECKSMFYHFIRIVLFHL